MTFLTDLVLGLIEDEPGRNVDELMPELPEYTREQVKQALQNLSHTKRARCERQGVKGKHKGAKPGRYWPVEVPLVRREQAPSPGRVSSVWDLGAVA